MNQGKNFRSPLNSIENLKSICRNKLSKIKELIICLIRRKIPILIVNI